MWISILRCKIPTFYDDLWIRQEMKYITHIFIVSFMIYLITVGLLYYFPKYTPMIIAISLISSATCVTFISWINSYWVARHAEIWILSSNRYSVIINESKVVPPQSPGSRSNAFKENSHSNKILNDVQLIAVLENDILFQAFLEHLNEEFSLECLLSLIEIIQFKQVIMQYIKDKDNDNDIDFSHIKYIDFPSFVPKSEIVSSHISNFNGDRWKEIKYRAYLLYIKYIENSHESEYQINISYELRSRFDNLMQTKNVWMDEWVEDTESSSEILEQQEEHKEDIEYKMRAYDLLNMFNSVSVDMIQLLEYSLNRYKNNLNDDDTIELVYGKTQMTTDRSI